MLDVTISGSTPAAEQGELTLFGGGDQDRFATAEAIFRVIVRKYFYVGPSGSGATMKLVVNSLLGIGMQAIAEAVAFGEKAGLDRNRLLDVLSQTAVVAPAHVGKLQGAMTGDYSPQFPLRLMNKDFVWSDREFNRDPSRELTVASMISRKPSLGCLSWRRS